MLCLSTPLIILSGLVEGRVGADALEAANWEDEVYRLLEFQAVSAGTKGVG